MAKVQRSTGRGDPVKGVKVLAFIKYAKVLAFAMLLFGVLTAAPGVWADESNGKNVYLQPGDTYNAGSAGNNTTVYIDKSGEYTLKGESDNVRFIIKTGGVKVYLADGLYIDPGAYANTGKKASAISVQHKSGDVTLISKAGASIYFSSYNIAPAIQQDGTDGKLIFETENPDNPGKIIAKCADKSKSAAIGSGGGEGTTGNIIFNSGYIYATGGDYAAAIGGGNGSKGKGITINGGYVNAQGGEKAAGIGSGMYKGASEITINGGEVDAKGGKGGAGIGSGLEIENSPIKGEHITITGGEVTATGGMGSAGIGGGRNADGEDIKITGGTVDATGGSAGGAGIGGGGSYDDFGYGGDSYIGGDGRNITISGGTVTATGGEDGAGIGGGCEEGNGENITIRGGTVVADGVGDGAGIGGAVKGRAKDITISGGKVTATGAGGGAGIGGGMHAWGHNLKISGGIVRATGGKNGDGIGGGKKPGIFYKDFTNSVFISGGTVIAAKGSEGSADIGGRGKSTVSITGGSVLPRNHDVNQAPQNQAGDTVYMTTVTFYHSSGEDYAKHKIDSLNFTDKTPKYGTNDLYNVNSTSSAVWPWLPKKSGAGVESGMLTEDDGTGKVTKKYTALEIEDQTADPWIVKQKSSIEPESHGAIYPPNDIILDNGRNADKLSNQNAEELKSLKDGSATGEFMETKLGNFKPVSGSITGMHIEGYGPSRVSDECIADAEGNLIYNDIFPEFVNEKGQWITAGSQVTLYAVWMINYYNIRFDPNKPATASHEVTGDMTDQRIQYAIQEPLNHNKYTLQGWRFVDWNTKADGTGDPYVDGENVMNMTAEHDATITLYAQWEPTLTYDLTFDSGEGTGDPHIQRGLLYDTPKELDLLERMSFTAPPDQAFLGWSHSAFGRLYEDGETVTNLFTENEAAGTITGWTLTAQWGQINEEIVVVKKDDKLMDIGAVGLDGSWDCLLLQEKGKPDGALFEMIKEDTGVYSIANLPVNSNPDLPGNKPLDGEYRILLGKADAVDDKDMVKDTGRTIEVNAGKLNIETLDYCTVEIEIETGKETYGSVWLGDDENKKQDAILKGDQIKINCEVTTTGQHFTQYTVTGHTPTWDTGCTETNPSQTITVTGKALLTAHIEPIHYKVSFDANAEDVTGVMDNQEFIYAQQRDLYPCQYRKENYTFAGWNTQADGKGQKYGDGEPIGETAEVKDNLTTLHNDTVILYAQWNKQPYTLHYDSNGADSGGWALDQRGYYDSETPLQNAAQLGFGMPNYHFTSWNTRSGGDGTAYQAGQTVSNLAKGGETIILYAQWAHDSYTVHYNGNGGTGTMLDEEFWTDAYEPLHKATFKRDGYTFTGWNTKRDGTGAAYDDREEVKNLAKAGGSVTLYAQWKQGGSDGSSETGAVGSPWIPAILMIASLGICAVLLRRRRKT